MDTNLLRSWLGLPPGPWPPPDRELLGAGGGPIDARSAERRAMELMGLLRPHQLRNPDLVTEGMNRIAQALIAVTAFGAAAPAPTKAPPVPPPPAPVAKVSVPASPTVVLPKPTTKPVFESIDLAPTKPAPAPSPVVEPEIPEAEVVAGPSVLDAEVFDALPAPTLPPPPAVIARPERAERPPVPIEDAEPLALKVPDVGTQRAERRAAYRELAALRGVQAAWEKLLPFLGDPSEDLPTAGLICEFLEATFAFREAEAHRGLPPELLDDVSPGVASVLRQPLVLAVFRSLTLAQRRALAREWAIGRATFRDLTEKIRERLRNTRPKRSVARQLEDIGMTFAWNPEWILIVATMMIVGIAAWRSLPISE